MSHANSQHDAWRDAIEDVWERRSELTVAEIDGSTRPLVDEVLAAAQALNKS